MIATDCPEGRPDGRNSKSKIVTLVAVRHMRSSQSLRLGFWIELLLVVDEINTRLLGRALARRLARELDRQNVKWN